MTARLISALALALLSAAPLLAEPIARPTPYAGAVITARGGEELRFPTEALWRYVEPEQRLIGGDTIRTNAFGTVSILFEDRTQIRVGRNSTLLVKDIARGPGGETRLSLPQGSIYARASRGGAGVTVETPAAAAAIRGTDWSLSVEGSKTALVVLEGEVVLQNALGSVTARQGEGAEAIVGQAPRKITLANYKGREQLLLYRELRDSFFELSPTDRTRTEERRARAAALSRSEGARRADDWLILAETGLFFDGEGAVRDALAKARASALDARGKARADLVEGFLAARALRWKDAARLFRAAEPRLDASRRATAFYAAWVANALAEPNRKPPPLPGARFANVPNGALARASVESFTESPRRGIEVLTEAEKRFPNDVMLLTGKAALLLLDSDEAAAKIEIERARRIDPDEPYLLTVSARYRWTIKGDLESARRELDRAAAIAPGASFVWNEIALVEDERGATREAEAAHLKAIALDPANPLSHSNHANFLIDQNQLPAADAALKKAEAIDPNGYIQIVTRGRLMIRQGKRAEGTDKLLAASAVNPTYAGGLLELAITNYRDGALDEAKQALDNADRYDDDNPTTPIIRSAIAVDDFEADEAIVQAREAEKRRLAKGGDYAVISESRQDGSAIADAFRFLELDDWGRFYGDRAFDMFSATAYFDQALNGAFDPFAAATLLPPDDATPASAAGLSTLAQGLLLSPLGAAGPERRSMFFNAPFAETTFGGGPVFSDGQTGWTAVATVQGKAMEPTPVAAFINASIERPDARDPQDKAKLESGVALFGWQPTPYDAVVLFGTHGRQLGGLRTILPELPGKDETDASISNFGAAWSHTISERNIVQAMVAGAWARNDVKFDDIGALPTNPPVGVFYRSDADLRQIDAVGAVSHLVGIGDIDVKYGVEGVFTEIKQRQNLEVEIIGVGLLPATTEKNKTRGRSGRAYVDALWKPTERLRIEGALFASTLKFDTPTGDREKQRLSPRIGVAFEPISGQWLRAVYRDDTLYTTNLTLAPIATVGVTPAQLPFSFGGRAETIAARWDAEWTKRLFTALEYQRQDIKGLTIGDFGAPNSLDLGGAKLDRAQGTANLWLGHGLGAFASFARSWSKTTTDAVISDPVGTSFTLARGADLPYLPKEFARLGMSFVSPAMWKATVAQSFGEGRSDVFGNRLKDFTTTDVSFDLEALDKRLLLDVDLLNLFDKRIETSPLARGQGRTITATARLRW